ncbi:hypothetical protein CS542_04160 [Pedobacter sp. IW39]|nr:hypothetical protein CS542_04160 [Pedobacter sp. IW39]
MVFKDLSKWPLFSKKAAISDLHLAIPHCLELCDIQLAYIGKNYNFKAEFKSTSMCRKPSLLLLFFCERCLP